MLPPHVPGYQWKVLLTAGRKTKEKACSYTGFGMLLELLGWLSGGGQRYRTGLLPRMIDVKHGQPITNAQAAPDIDKAVAMGELDAD
jgi:hypothetical protein